MEKTCKTCINLCNKRGEVEQCKNHRSEVQEMIKEIDEKLTVEEAVRIIKEEGYMDFERTKIGGNMNKFQKELIEKCKEVSHFKDAPLFDDIYVLPTTRKHDSGYKILYVIGQTRKDDTYYLLDTYCDVVDFGECNSMIKDLHIEVLNNGIIHYWSNYQQFKSIFRVSSCTFEMINRKKLLWGK